LTAVQAHNVIAEIERQIATLSAGGRIVQETRGWDEYTGTTHSMRSKEQAHDYRYFPDPDLVPIEIDGKAIEAIRHALPELPHVRFERYHREFGLTVAQATQLIDNLALAEYFEECVQRSGNAKQSVNLVSWVRGIELSEEEKEA